MQDSQQLLFVALLVILGIEFALCAKKGFSAYGAIFAGREFKYRFDATKTPAFIIALAVTMLVSYAFGYAVSKDRAIALEFSLATSSFSIICFGVLICLIPSASTKDKK